MTDVYSCNGMYILLVKLNLKLFLCFKLKKYKSTVEVISSKKGSGALEHVNEHRIWSKTSWVYR